MTDINVLTDRERAEMMEQLSQMQADMGLNGDEVQPPPATHTLLEVWSSILGDIETMRAEPISMASASQTLNSYPFLRLHHLSAFHERFYDHLLEYREILEAEIATDPSCFKHVEDDAEKNREHYLTCWWRGRCLHCNTRKPGTTPTRMLPLSLLRSRSPLCSSSATTD